MALERFYVLIDGRMELNHINPETGKCFSLMILHAGDAYDVLSLLDEKGHDAMPVALDELTTLSAPIGIVRQWLIRHADFNRNLMTYLGQSIRIREDIASDLALLDTATRLARVILRHVPKSQAEDVHQNSGINVELLHDLTNEQLAELVGSVRQVINRHLGEMKKEGVLHIESNQMIVDDLQRLKEKADDMHGHLQRLG